MEDPFKLVVAAAKSESDVVRSIELRAEDGGKLPSFTAGSHVDLHLPNGLRRSYSLLNNPEETDRYVLGVSRAPDSRGGSAYLHDSLQVGETILVGAPRNTFPLLDNTAHTILLAGGIGITPMLSMIHRLETTGDSWELHYAVRSQAVGAFRELLCQYGSRVSIHVDQEAGRPLDLMSIIERATTGSHFYCCGPEPMLAAFLELTKSIPSDRVHYEYFSADIEVASEGGFELELRQSGITVAVPAGKTILDALLDQGIDVDYNCQEGHCGTCIVRVLEGTPDHRDLYLTEDEQSANDQIAICCSGCKSQRLVLDI